MVLLRGGSRDAKLPDYSGLDTTESTRLCAIEMARLLLYAYPGDWIQGQNMALIGKLWDFVRAISKLVDPLGPMPLMPEKLAKQ